MGTTHGRETDAVTFFAALAHAPYNYDFYQTLRRLECLYSERPRWGAAQRPVDEPIRLGQDPDLSFAPAPLASFEAGSDSRAPRLQVRLFGLLGPNGPLPVHITEYVRERLRHAGDPTLSRFLDLFHHRFLELFYRAWAQAQPHVNRDRPKEDRFAAYVGSFVGVSPDAFRDRDALPDLAKLFHVSALVRQVRNAEGLRAILEHFFRVPVRIEEFVGHTLFLGSADRTQLAHQGATLGTGAVLGSRVWDRQHKFRVRMGPLTLEQYRSFLPATPKPLHGTALTAPRPWRGEGGPQSQRRERTHDRAPLRQLADWVRTYLCFELQWDVRLVLKRREIPQLKLGAAGQLGWTTWLGHRRAETDADDLCLDAEAYVERTMAGAA